MPGYHDPIQHHRRLNCFSLDAIEEYFSQLNPIAKRISCDINDTRSNYGNLWNTLDYQEQSEIINDTLIKPEISLRYFDNFLTPTPTNSSDNSYQSSTDSLTAIVLKDVAITTQNVSGKEDGDRKKNILLKPYEVKCNGIKNFYSYDGRNLNTFGIQKVALKIVQDEALGCFRDEHSGPFCYRTKSQIDLFALSPTEPMADHKKIGSGMSVATNLKPSDLKSHEDCGPGDDSKNVLHNYHRLQHQLKINLRDKKSQDSQNSPLSYLTIKPSSISVKRKILKSPDTSYKLEVKDKMSSVSKNSKSSMLQNYINSTQINITPKIGVNYAVFSDAYNTSEENSNLLQHCGQSDLTIGSCSSATTSDDEKTLEEDVHLLDNDSNIRKGFDFLNNW